MRGVRTVLPFFFSFNVRWASSRIIYKTARKVPSVMTSLLSVFFFFFLRCLSASLFGPCFIILTVASSNTPREGGRGLLGLIFTGYVQLASQNPYPIIVSSVANYRSKLSHFLFLWIDPFFRLNGERFTFHLQYKHSGTFVRNIKNCLTPKIRKCATPFK